MVLVQFRKDLSNFGRMSNPKKLLNNNHFN